MLYQYGNPANADAHYQTTGPELLTDLPDHHALRGRSRHHRHAHGRRPLPPGDTSPTSRSSPPNPAMASWSTACATSTRVSSRSSTTRSLDSRFSVGPRDAVRRTRELLELEGIFAGHLDRRDPARGAGLAHEPPRPASAPTSRSSSATAAGSTCRPVPTTAPWTRPRPRSRASSGPESPRVVAPLSRGTWVSPQSPRPASASAHPHCARRRLFAVVGAKLHVQIWIAVQ